MKPHSALTAAALIAAFGATAHAQVPDDERVPQKDSTQEFPRWLRQIHVDGFWNPTQSTTDPNKVVAAFTPSIAVDSKNVVHIVYAGWTQLQYQQWEQSSIPPTPEIFYTHNRYKDRRANSWSPPLNVSNSGAASSEPDIYIGEWNRVHISWTEAGNTIYYAHVAYSHTTGASVAAGPFATSLNNHRESAITADSNSPSEGIHIVATNKGTPQIDYAFNPWPPSGLPTAMNAPFQMVTGSANGMRPRVHHDDAYRPHVAWIAGGAPFYNLQNNGTWLAAVQIAPAGVNVDLFVDRAASGTNYPHVTFDVPNVSPPGIIKYSRSTTSSPAPPNFATIETVSTLGGYWPRILVDTRLQPHINWVVAGGVSYAAKVNRPNTSNQVWGRQEATTTITKEPFARLEICINKNDNIYLTFDYPDSGGIGPPPTNPEIGGLPEGSPGIIRGEGEPGGEGFNYNRRGAVFYSKVIEFNLGEQDATGNVAVGPNAIANAATGSLQVVLPIFSTKGVGFATALSLVHNSQEWDSGVISQGWTHNYHYVATDHEDGGVISMQAGDGSTVVYLPDGAFGGSTIAEYEFGEFSQWNTATLMTTKSGIKYSFDLDTGKLTQIEDTNTNKIQFAYFTNAYGKKGLLQTITDTPGRTTGFAYNSTSQISTITDPAGKTYTLDYAAAGLSNVWHNGPPQLNWSISYWGSSGIGMRWRLIEKITTPRTNQTQFWYYMDNRFKESQDPTLTVKSLASDGSPIPTHPKRRFTYESSLTPSSTDLMKATYTDRRDVSGTFHFQYKRALIRKVVDANAKTYERTFDGTYRNLKSEIDKRGNTTEYTYRHEMGGSETPAYVRDLLGEVKGPGANSPASGQGATQILTRYTYSNNIFRVLTVQAYFAGNPDQSNTTKYHYDADVGSYAADPDPNITIGNLRVVAHPPTAAGDCLEKWTVDGKGRPTSYKTPRNVDAGVQTTYSYVDPTTGLVTSVVTPEHTSAEQFAYTTMGDVYVHVEPLGGTTTHLYDNHHRLYSVTLAAGDETAVVGITYDNDGNEDVVTGPGTESVDYDYDELGRLIQETTKLTDAAGAAQSAVEKLRYDPEENAREHYDPRDRKTTWTYDSLGRVQDVTVPGAPGPDVKTAFTYDDNGQVETETVGTTPTTVTWVTTYTGRGLPKERYNQATSSIKDETDYWEDGLVRNQWRKASGTKINGTYYGYDAQRQLTSTGWSLDPLTGGGASDPKRIDTRDKNGNVTTSEDAEGRKSSVVLDQHDRVRQTKDHYGTVLTETTPNDNDQPENVKKADPSTGAPATCAVCTYDSRKSLKTVTDASGQVMVLTYDASGRVKQVQLPGAAGSNCNVRNEYDRAGRLIETVHDPGDPDEVRWKYQYYADGLLSKLTDPRGKTYEYEYNANGQLVEMRYPASGGGQHKESWGYEARGWLKTHIDANGKAVSYDYDERGRVTSEIHTAANGVVLSNVARTYDNSGNLTSVTDSVTRIKVSYTLDGSTPAYDAVGRLKEVRWYLEAGTGNEVLFKRVQYTAYDKASNVTEMFDAEGNKFAYGYDGNNRLTTIARTPSPGTGTPVTMATIAYYSNGQRKSITLDGGLVTSYKYDSKGRLASLATAQSSGNVLSHFEYEYDERDRRKKMRIEHLGAEITYGYDCHDRLTSEAWSSMVCVNNIQALTPGNMSSYSNTATTAAAVGSSIPSYTATFTYDAAGNRLTKTVNGTQTSYVYDDLNRLTSETTSGTTTTYGHDANGNQISRSVGSSSEYFDYDHLNRIAYYRKYAGSYNSVAHRYGYTPTGERMAKVDDLDLDQNEQWFMYDGNDTTADYSRTTGSASFALLRTYVNGRRIDSKIARVDPGASETVRYYLGDALGTAHELATASGAIERRSLVTAWGEDLPGYQPIATIADRHGFTQRERDDEAGILHFRARSYDARTGRFLQKDPPLARRASSHYVYARNNPTNFVDPLGLQEDNDWLAGMGRALWSAIRKVPGKAYDATVGAVVHRVKQTVADIEKVVQKTAEGDIWGAYLATLEAAYHAPNPFLGGMSLEAGVSLVQGEQDLVTAAVEGGIYTAQLDAENAERALQPIVDQGVWMLAQYLVGKAGSSAWKAGTGKSTGPGAQSVGVADSAAARSVPLVRRLFLRWRHRKLIRALRDAGPEGGVEVAKGGNSPRPGLSRQFPKELAKLMGEVTAATGREVGLARLTNGKRVLRLGYYDSTLRIHTTSGVGVRKWIAHTHVSGNLELSWPTRNVNGRVEMVGDVSTMQALGQRRTHLIDDTGRVQRRLRDDLRDFRKSWFD